MSRENILKNTPCCIGLFESHLRGHHTKRKNHPFGWFFLLAEQQGFEPWRRFHALRDFESRLFDQLEYCSITEALYQLSLEKAIIFFRALR